jgi:hypothetical protein
MDVQTLPSNAHRKQPTPAIAGHHKEYILQQNPSLLPSFFAPGIILHESRSFTVLPVDHRSDDRADGTQWRHIFPPLVRHDLVSLVLKSGPHA